MPALTSREIHLKSRPSGLPTADNFELVEVSLPEPRDGEILVRNIFMSVDPYMRGRMNAGPSYAAGFELHQPMTGGCVGQVVQSKHPHLNVGDYVLGMQGWREAYRSDGSGLSKIDPNLAPIQAFLGAVGMPGMTAYVGLLDIGRSQAGETVFVSAAAGAVGSIVCQIAKIKGCRVVGSAGSEEKIAWLLDEAGIDAALNYKQVKNLRSELGRLCPDGIDIYFENVGGEHLQAALTHMNQNGRIPVCGMIARYNDTESVPGPSNLGLIVGKRLTLQGFIVGDHQERRGDFYADMGRWIAEGKITWRETIVEGLENAPQAFMGLFEGQNIGKMLVKVGPDPAV